MRILLLGDGRNYLVENFSKNSYFFEAILHTKGNLIFIFHFAHSIVYKLLNIVRHRL